MSEDTATSRQISVDATASQQTSVDTSAPASEAGLSAIQELGAIRGLPALDPLSLANLPGVFPQILSEDPVQRHQGCRRLRELLARSDPTKQARAAVQLGLLKILSAILDAGEEAQVYEGLWCLANIAECLPDQTILEREQSLQSKLTSLLHSPSPKLRAQAIWVLGNVFAAGQPVRHAFLATNIQDVLMNSHASFVLAEHHRTVAWALRNLCCDSFFPTSVSLTPLLQFSLARFLVDEDNEALAHYAWILLSFSLPDTYRGEIFQKQHVTRMVALLNEERPADLRKCLLRLIGYFVSQRNVPPASLRQLVDDGLVVRLRAALASGSQADVRKDALWVLSNLASESLVHQALVESQVLVEVARFIRTEPVSSSRDGLVCIVFFFQAAERPQLVYAVHHGFMQFLVDGLSSSEKAVQLHSLEAIRRILAISDPKLVAFEEHQQMRQLLAYGAYPALSRIAAVQEGTASRLASELLLCFAPVAASLTFTAMSVRGF
eukprot:m.92747 g.92747  ORF g.92747 m.92747 type:complete len:494 (-) comp51172_c0_seq2:18-1499(-)